MEFSIITDSNELTKLINNSTDDKIVVSDTIHNVGAVESWFEIIITLGIAGIPNSVAVNIISLWLSNKIIKSKNSDDEKTVVDEKPAVKVVYIDHSSMKSMEFTINTVVNDEKIIKNIFDGFEGLICKIGQ